MLSRRSQATKDVRRVASDTSGSAGSSDVYGEGDIKRKLSLARSAARKRRLKIALPSLLCSLAFLSAGSFAVAHAVSECLDGWTRAALELVYFTCFAFAPLFLLLVLQPCDARLIRFTQKVRFTLFLLLAIFGLACSLNFLFVYAANLGTVCVPLDSMLLGCKSDSQFCMMPSTVFLLALAFAYVGFTGAVFAAQCLHGLFQLHSVSLLESIWRQLPFCYLAFGMFCMLLAGALLHAGRGVTAFANALGGCVYLMVALLVRMTSLRTHMQHWLGNLGEALGSPAILGAFLLKSGVEDAFRAGCQSLKAISAEKIQKSMLAPHAADAIRVGLAIASSFGEVDAFVSHSWSDDLDAKWTALQEWRAEFKRNHRREPLLWIDCFCVEQDDVAKNLRHIPVHLSGCKTLLILCGRTYLVRLWCLFELFVFMELERSVNRLQVIPLSNSETELALIRDSAASVDIKFAACSKRDDTETLLAALEAGFGGAKGFNDWMRDTLPRMMPSCCHPVSVADPTYVRGVSMPALLLHTGLLSLWRLWRVGVDRTSLTQKQRLHGISRQAKGKLGVFLSHSWATSGFYKAVHLQLHACASESALVLLLIQALIFSCCCWEILPNFNQTWTITLFFDDATINVRTMPYCLFLSPSIWLLTILSMPVFKHLFAKGQLFFLDAVCINQYDPVMKRRGIDNFEAVLREAGQLHVLLSPEYLKRLWCVFELAGFLSNKGMESIVFFHVMEAPLLLIIVAVVWLVSAATWICWSAITSTVPPETQDLFGYISFAICFLLLLFPFHIARNWIHSSGELFHQLASFDMMMADCSDAEDKQYIEDRIVAWHGSVDDFCKHVREDLYPKLRMSGALSLQPSYAKSMFVSSVVVGFQLDVIAGLIIHCSSRPDHLAQYILQCLCLDLAVYPLAIYTFFGLAHVPMRDSRVFNQATSLFSFLAGLAVFQGLELSLIFAKKACFECLLCAATVISLLTWLVYQNPFKFCWSAGCNLYAVWPNRHTGESREPSPAGAASS